MKNPITIFLIIIAAGILSFAQNRALFPIEQNGKTGYIDSHGKIVIRPVFDEGWPFHEGLAPVRIDDAWGYIDETGKVVIEPQFFQADNFFEGLASVGVFFEKREVINEEVGYYNYIDRTGKQLSADHFGVAFDFSDSLAQVLTADYKHGVIDRTGKIRFYFDIYNGGFKDGLAMFKTHGNMPDTRIGYIDKTGKVVIEATFREGEDFSEGLACVYTEQGAGYIDKSGKFVVAPKFTYCREFLSGLAAVNMDGLWGYIDKAGTIVIKPQFAEVSKFSDDVAVVRSAAVESVSEKSHKQDDNIISTKEGLFGVIDRKGKFIIPAKFTQIGDFENGLAWVNLTGSYIVHGSASSWGYINKSGKLVWRTK